MSASPRNRTSWLNQNYDKLILIVVLIGLLGSALFLVVQIGRVRQSLAEAKWERPDVQPKMVQPIDLAEIDKTRAAFASPFQSGEFTNRLMTSEIRVSCVECGKPIGFSATKCPFCGAEQPAILNPEEIDSDGDGMPDKFEQAVGLNYLDHEDAARDMDNDGFSNLEEYQAKTKLNDAKDSPPPTAKLRLIRVGSNPFKLRFQGDAKLPDGSIRYQLNLKSLERTYFVRVGDEIEGFKVLEYLPETPEGSTIIVKQGDSKIRLVKGKAITQYEMVADVIFLIDRSRFRLRVGETFKLKDQEYKVIDIRQDRVLIRDVKTNQSMEIGLLSQDERNQLMTSGAESSAPAPGFVVPEGARTGM
ncbi:MAG TPA: zinc ribbon domain-containing protein [Kiritimatiellia bacterium]|nr:zinc ribbon domain-containing protein [Kiritimatiellia bacterium]